LDALRTTRPKGVAGLARKRLWNQALTPKAREVATECACNPAVLRREFAEACGEPLRHHQIRTRLAKAVILLRSTDWKVEAIAREVGWASKKNLYFHLRRATGLTPAQVRLASEGTLTVLAEGFTDPQIVPRATVQDR